MGRNEELFKFAAKIGALEGYLYHRDRVEPLENWVGNIEKMYAALPDTAKRDIKAELSGVLTRVLSYGENVLDNDLRARLTKLLRSL